MLSFSLLSYVLLSCFCFCYDLCTLLFVRVCVFVRDYSEEVSFFFPLSKDLLWVTSCVLPILPIMRVTTSRVPTPPPLPIFSPTLNRIPTPPHTLLAKCHSWGWKKMVKKILEYNTHTNTLTGDSVGLEKKDEQKMGKRGEQVNCGVDIRHSWLSVDLEIYNFRWIKFFFWFKKVSKKTNTTILNSVTFQTKNQMYVREFYIKESHWKALLLGYV